jgi:hypothetical protein
VVTLTVNGEAPFTTWWDEVCELRTGEVFSEEEIPAELEWVVESLIHYEEVTVPRDLLWKFHAWAATLPGWDHGPAYAQCAILVDDRR